MNPQAVNTAIAAGIYLAAVATAWRIRGYIDPAEVAISLAFIWLIIDRLHANIRDEDTRADIDRAGADIDGLKIATSDLDDLRAAIDEIVAYLNATAGTDAEPTTAPIPVPQKTTEPMELGDELAADAHAHVVMQQQDKPTVPTVEKTIGGITFRVKEDAA